MMVLASRISSLPCAEAIGTFLHGLDTRVPMGLEGCSLAGWGISVPVWGQVLLCAGAVVSAIVFAVTRTSCRIWVLGKIVVVKSSRRPHDPARFWRRQSPKSQSCWNLDITIVLKPNPMDSQQQLDPLPHTPTAAGQSATHGINQARR